MKSAITLLGMSGAGKTYFSQMLSQWGWDHYSCDFEIAKRLNINVSVDDLSALSVFIGQVGDEALGGLPVDEFKRRQKMYYDAECGALRDMAAKIGDANFVHDSTGSFCEITDEGLIHAVAEETLLVYIETPKDSHAEIIERAKAYPKPLYFPPVQFDVWLAEYCKEQGVSVAEIVPNDFSAWVFPKLFMSRLPKYERLTKEYGVVISSDDLRNVKSEQEFIGLIQTAKP